jgi:hypothetical protein
MNMDVVHGKEMHGEVLQEGVKDRIEQADALVSFFTMRQGQENAAFNTHVWVRDELVHALALKKPAVEIYEKGVHNPEGLVGNRQRINLDPDDKLAAISELIQAIAGWSMRHLLLCPLDEAEARNIHLAVRRRELTVRYRTRIDGVDSRYREGRLERVNQGLHLSAVGIVRSSLVQIEGTTQSQGVLFDTGWVSADLVRIEF